MLVKHNSVFTLTLQLMFIVHNRSWLHTFAELCLLQLSRGTLQVSTTKDQYIRSIASIAAETSMWTFLPLYPREQQAWNNALKFFFEINVKQVASLTGCLFFLDIIGIRMGTNDFLTVFCFLGTIYFTIAIVLSVFPYSEQIMALVGFCALSQIIATSW